MRPCWLGGGGGGHPVKKDLKVKHSLAKPCLRDQSTVKTNAKCQKISTLPAGDSWDQNQCLNIQAVHRPLRVYFYGLCLYSCFSLFNLLSILFL
jgi:hypothetical protein